MGEFNQYFVAGMAVLGAGIAMVAGLGYRYLMDGKSDDDFLSASARVTAFKKF